MKAPFLASFAALSVVTALAGPAAAHTILVNPPPIGQDDGAKSGPCGCYFGGGPEDPNDDPSPAPCPGDYPVTTLQAGTQLKIEWKETINHDGNFRLAFASSAPDATTKAAMDGGVVIEIPDENGTSGATLSQTITVPSTPCDLCTIQLRQFMMGAANPYYYSCAAVKIVAAGSTSSGTGGAGGGAGGMGQGAASAGGNGAGASSQGGVPFSTGAGKAEPQPEIKSGCNVGGEAPGLPEGALLAIAGLSFVSLVASMRAGRRRRG